jgi:hypothetical protein
MVLCRTIASGIEVGMQFNPAVPTHKPATRTAVVAGGVPTAATHLRGMSRVNRNHRTTPFFGFVLYKGFQLSERPAMNTALGLGLVSAFHPLADIGQVFNYNRRTRLRRTDDLLTQDMVVVPAKARLLATETFQVPLGRLRAFLLELALQVKQLAFGCLPAPLSQELIGARNGGSDNPQVNPNHLIGWRNLRRGHGDNNVQPPAATPEQQIGSIDRIARVLGAVFRNVEAHRLPPTNQRHPYGLTFPIQRVATLVIARCPAQAC